MGSREKYSKVQNRVTAEKVWEPLQYVIVLLKG